MILLKSIFDHYIVSKSHARRDGIALIIMLGFLSILTIICVSFIITMRTERVISNSYLEKARADELLFVGLNNAVLELDTVLDELSERGIFYPDFSTFEPARIKDILISDGPEATAVADILQNGADQYIPDHYYTDADTFSGAAEWIPIEIDDPVDPGVKMVLGRYAYMVINCSGLVDINEKRGLDGRTNSAYLGEIDFSDVLLSDINKSDLEARDARIELLETYRRMESLPEFQWVARGEDACDFLPAEPANFFIYSMAPNKWIDENDEEQDRLFLGVDAETVLSKEAEIKPLLKKYLFDGDAAKTDAFFLNLIDYLDEDHLPGNRAGSSPENFDGICLERVPMINEIKIVNQIEVSGVAPDESYKNNLQVNVELCYPFPEKESTAYEYTVTVEVESEPSDVSLAIDGPPAQSIVSIPDNSSTAQNKKRYFESGDIELESVSVPHALPADLPTEYTLKIIVKDDAGYIVDQVRDLKISSADLKSDFSGGDATKYFAVTDPRLNFNGADADIWKGPQETKSWNGPNDIELALVGPNYENNTLYQVRNDNRLDSVAELAYITYDSTPWKRAELFNYTKGSATAAYLLDAFTVKDEEGSQLHGCISPNTDLQGVLASVFYHVDSASPYIGDSSLAADELTAAEAKEIADVLLAESSDFTSKGQLAELDFSAVSTFKTWDSACIKPYVLSKCIELFEPRQQLFTIIVVSQAGKQTPSGDFAPTAEKRGVAVVWRDPVAIHGGNRFVVRSLKWLVAE